MQGSDDQLNINQQHVSRSKSKETVVDTRYAEESVATSNTTQSLDASELAEELRNQLDTADAEKGRVTGTLPRRRIKVMKVKTIETLFFCDSVTSEAKGSLSTLRV
nr:hypothetical protein [Tanacetum cinerariifolium]